MTKKPENFDNIFDDIFDEEIGGLEDDPTPEGGQRIIVVENGSQDIDFLRKEAKALKQPRQSVAVHVSRCSRCFQDHGKVMFRRFSKPYPVNRDDFEIWGWAPCPYNQEPILLFFNKHPD